MGSAATWINVAGSVMGAMGAADAGDAAEAQGIARQQAAQYRAEQLRVNAGQAQAQGQFASLEEMRKSKLIQSRALALAAASGGGASDPTIVHLISSVAGEGELARLTQIYNGDERARGMRNEATAAEYEGDQYRAAGESAKDASRFKVMSSILSGASSMAGGLSSSSSSSSGYDGTWTSGNFDTSAAGYHTWDP